MGGIVASGATGGRMATDGKNSGGVSGTGGAPGGGGPGTGGIAAECDQYMRDYEVELVNARTCNDKKAKACAMAVPAKLAGCGSACITFVDTTAMLDQIQNKWMKAGCTAPACPTSLCLNSALSICSPLTGSCTDGLFGL
jgi:hypothetical protein